MSVRWKPLILLTCLFVVLAAMGLLAITSVLMPGRAEDVLPLAQAELKAGRFDRAVIQFERALQRDPKSAQIQLELARALSGWMQQDADQVARQRPKWLNALNQAARLAPQDPEPRRLLLAEALRQEDGSDAVHWAGELIGLDPDNLDACYVLALDALDNLPPNVEAARDFARKLEASEPDRTRTHWVNARLAEVTQDHAALESLLATRPGQIEAAALVDLLAGLRLEALALTRAVDRQDVETGITRICEAASLVNTHHAAPGVGRQLIRLLEQAQRRVNRARVEVPDQSQLCDQWTNRLAQVAEQTHATCVRASHGNDLRPYQAYAEFLLLSENRARCLEVVDEALKQPAASAALWLPHTMELREIGIKSALSDAADPQRFERAAVWIRELLASPQTRYEALGHLFQGVIELELATLAESKGSDAERDRLRKSALTHLKASATGLRDVATAQALYGVALVLAKEPALARQYLTAARQMGGDQLDPRYQIWAAWSMLQAGYPEDAEPMVERLLAQAEAGGQAREILPTLHYLHGEVLQAARTPERLRKAADSYRLALATGYPRAETVELRLAEIEAALGNVGNALKAADALRDTNPAAAAADRLAILALRERGKIDEANTRLAEARARHPDDPELIGLQAALLADAGNPAAAEALLSEFLQAHPKNEDLVLYRTKLLSSSLGKVDEARALLQELAKSSENSAPWVQLVLLEISTNRLDAAEQALAKLRALWSESATTDLLGAQLALAQGDTRLAMARVDAALVKDPRNKLVQYWKARLSALAGGGAESQAILEAIVRDRPSKEVESGVSLTTASQLALASMAAQRRDFKDAVSRYETILNEGALGNAERATRWNLAQARAAAGDVTRAKSEVDALLKHPNTTPDERVQAADFFRRHGDEPRANREIDAVLAREPNHPGAVTYRAMQLVARGQPKEAVSLVQKIVNAGQTPAGIYLLLSALQTLADAEQGPTNARAVLDEGLAAHPGNPELLRAYHQVLVLANEPDPVALVLQKANGHKSPAIDDLLIDLYQGQKQFDPALAVVQRSLASTEPASARAAQLTARSIALTLAQAAEQPNDRPTRLARAAEAIAEARKNFPGDTRFLALDCEHALAQDDLARAARLAEELAEQDKASPDGPLLQARVAAARRQPEEVARAYQEAVARSPARPELRLALGQLHVAGGQFDAALEQASAILDANADLVPAQMLKAQALALQTGSDTQVAKNRAEAMATLERLIQASPAYADAYHLMSDLQVANGARPQAIETLKRGLKNAPANDEGLGLLVQRLCEIGTNAALEQAEALATTHTHQDPEGRMALAAAVGFHRAGQSVRARPWAERAVARSNQIEAHLTLGDILLGIAESGASANQPDQLFRLAIEQYDWVLHVEPNSIEAINNKAWILHRHLGRHSEALALAETLARRVAADRLPPDFHDTLGSIQMALGQLSTAHASFQAGLAQNPQHPVLNLHMAQLLSKQNDRQELAREHLARARQFESAVPADLAAEMRDLAATLDAAN